MNNFDELYADYERLTFDDIQKQKEEMWSQLAEEEELYNKYKDYKDE